MSFMKAVQSSEISIDWQILAFDVGTIGTAQINLFTVSY